MLLRLHYDPTIDNPRNCSPECVEALRRLLIQGARATPDPHRKGFYDVENGERVFYVHLAPKGNVWLLATWRKEARVAPSVSSREFAAARL